MSMSTVCSSAVVLPTLAKANNLKAESKLASSIFGFPAHGSSLNKPSFSLSARTSFSSTRTNKFSMNLPSWIPRFGAAPAASVQGTDSANPALDLDNTEPGPGLQLASFGAGCFWGVELAYQRVPGVVKTEVGYMNGLKHNPSYESVCSGRTGHVEAVRVAYDPSEVSYETLLDTLWQRHDPTQLNRQGGDVGTQYRSGIYFYTPEQEKVAKESLEKQEAKIGRKIVTEIVPARRFYRAEEYHQQYLAKGGRFGFGQSTEKGCKDPIRCYG